MHLQNFSISAAEFEAFQYCTNLRELVVTGPAQEFTGKAFDVVLKQARLILILCLFFCQDLVDVSGIRHLEYLNELSFSSCDFQTAKQERDGDPTCGMSKWNNEGQFMYLEKLEFVRVEPPADQEGALTFLEKGAPNLVDVTIVNVGHVKLSDKTFGYLRGSCSESIKSIQLGGLSALTDQGVEQTLKSMKKLERLRFEDAKRFSDFEAVLSDSVVTALAPTLKHLFLAAFKEAKINKSVLENGLSRLKSLEELFLFLAPFDDNCCDALLHLPNLLKFRSGSALAGTSLNFLRPCSNLVDLDVSYASSVSDISVLSSDLPKLEHLSLFECTSVKSLEPFRHRQQQQHQQQERRFVPLNTLDIRACTNKDISPLKGVAIQYLRFSLESKEPDTVLETLSQIPGLSTCSWENSVSTNYLTKEVLLKYFGNGGIDLEKFRLSFAAPPVDEEAKTDEHEEEEEEEGEVFDADLLFDLHQSKPRPLITEVQMESWFDEMNAVRASNGLKAIVLLT